MRSLNRICTRVFRYNPKYVEEPAETCNAVDRTFYDAIKIDLPLNFNADNDSRNFASLLLIKRGMINDTASDYTLKLVEHLRSILVAALAGLE